MAATIPQRRDTRANQAADERHEGGRPPHPAHVAAEALVEALTAVECDRDALLRIIHAQNQLCTLAADRASRLSGIVLPELRAGYEAAERLCSARIPAAEITGA